MGGGRGREGEERTDREEERQQVQKEDVSPPPPPTPTPTPTPHPTRSTGFMTLYALHEEMQGMLEAGANVPDSIREEEKIAEEVREESGVRERAGTGLRQNSGMSVTSTPSMLNLGRRSRSTISSESEAAASGAMALSPRDEALEAARDALCSNTVHFLMEYKLAIISAGEPLEMYFSLWSDAGKMGGKGGGGSDKLRSDSDMFLESIGEMAGGKAGVLRGNVISEEYLVRVTDKGMPQEISLMGQLKTLFTNVTKAELQGQ